MGAVPRLIDAVWYCTRSSPLRFAYTTRCHAADGCPCCACLKR